VRGKSDLQGARWFQNGIHGFSSMGLLAKRVSERIDAAVNDWDKPVSRLSILQT